VSGRLADSRPELVIVVDTEEEFDWTKPFDRANTSTRSIPAQERAHAVYDRLGIVPTYVVDYPVATNPEAIAFLKGLKQAGRAEIGAHLHSWVTPPHDEQVNARNSYQCNLSPALKHAKIEALTDAIARAFGERPTVFKAGRHGLGPRTPAMLASLGYNVDCSLLPYHDLRSDGGPDFRTARDQPFWIEGAAGLLEVPVTTGFFGAAAGLGRRQQAVEPVAAPRAYEQVRPRNPLAADPRGGAGGRAMPPARSPGARGQAHLQPGLSQPEPGAGQYALCGG